MNPEQPAPLPPLAPSKGKKKSRYPSKTCKYAGVTFRVSRDKYQARIYKGNKEYNLGLFDLSADAALAYDVAHRLVKKISAAIGKEKEALELYEANKDAPDWLDYGDNADANNGLDPEKLNFLRPLDFKTEREKEFEESRAAGSQKHEHCPKLEELRGLVNKEAIRVMKIIVGTLEGGTNNYRRKSKKAGVATKEGAPQDKAAKNPPKKRRKQSKSKDSMAPSGDSKESGTKKTPTDVTPAWVSKEGLDIYENLGQYYQANNQQMIRHMGNSTLQAMMEDNSTKTAALMNNQSHGVEHLMNKMLNDRQPQHRHESAASNSNAPMEKTTGNKSNNFFLQDTMQAGKINLNNKNPSEYNFMGIPGAMSRYPFGMGMGSGGGNHNSDALTGMSGSSNDFNSSQTPDDYREFFRNMRNYFPGMGASQPGGSMGPPPVGGQNNMPEEFQRMMLARAMGQNAGSHNAGIHHGMGSIMGVDSPSNVNQGNPFTKRFADQKKDDSTKQLENFKSMIQSGLDRSMSSGPPPGMEGPRPNNLHPGQISPKVLNMLRASGHFSSQGNTANMNGDGVTREQFAGMYSGDRLGQQLRALQSSHPFAGINPTSGFPGQFGSGDKRSGEGMGEGPSLRNGEQQQMSRSDQQQAYLQSFAAGQAANFPLASSGGGGMYGNPTFDNMAQFFGMSGSTSQPPSARNPGNNNDGKV